MNLYYITDVKLPTEKAHGYQVCKMCEEFGKKINTELIIPGRLTHIKENIFNYYDLKKTFSVKSLGSFNFVKWEKYIGGLTFYIQKLLFLFRLLKLDLNKDSLIYTRDVEVVWFFSKKGFKVVYEAHNWTNKSNVNKRMLKRAYKIICITKGLKNKYIEAGFDNNKILVAADGVDLEKFYISLNKNDAKKEIKGKLGNYFQDKEKLIVYVGHKYGWKGVDILKEASKEFSNNKNIGFILIGGYDEHKRIDDNIVFVPHISREIIPKILKAADVLILPNSGKTDISRLYTSPLKMFEYMASDRPIVASDLPSIREVLNEKNSVLVEPDNPEALAEGINKVLKDDKLSSSISKQSKKDVMQYSWEKRVCNILDFVI